MKATPLDDLARRISNQEAELQKLRREFEERRRHLASLTHRKEALQAQVQRIDTEITALVTGVQRKTAIQQPKPAKSTQGQLTKNAKTKSAKHPVPSRISTTEPGLTLPHLIVRIVREAPGALSISQIAEKALGRGFTTTSANFRNVVATRVHELRGKGMLRHADGQAGFVLGKAPPIQEAAGRKPALTKGNSKDSFPAPGKNSKPSQGKRQGEQPSLKSVLTRILERSQRPLVARDLAKRAVAIGYQSKSKDFEHLVQVTLSRMDGIANMPGIGYRLKKRRG
jgi:hypothetical protein